jgi:hypothetical protein
MSKGKFDNIQTEEQVVKLLEETKIAVSTDFVAYHLSISWVTARSLLLNMTIKGLVSMEKTTKSMIFRLPHAAEQAQEVTTK